MFSHPFLTTGSCCPSCRIANSGGKLRLSHPKVVVRLKSNPLISGTRYTTRGLYCPLCSDKFPVNFPDEIKNAPKYDVSCASSLAIARYSMGLPLYRIEKNQDMHEIPMRDATQWDLINGLHNVVCPVYYELVKNGSNGNLFYYDDTPGVIIENKTKGKPSHSTAFISIHEGKKIHLFITGLNTAGKNVDAILEHRTSQNSIIAMMDASPSNIPKKMTAPAAVQNSSAQIEPHELILTTHTSETLTNTDVDIQLEVNKGNTKLDANLAPMFILAFCLTHGRRKFFEIFKFFDQECDFVLEIISQVYMHDAHCKAKKYTQEQRLSYHQTHSSPLMQVLFLWLNNQLIYDLIEQNSGLGQAVRYMLRNWKPLTTFLRVIGAPLDNNWAERAIKIVIRHRRNSLFYRTNNGAKVGDCLMSIIYTCQQNNVNAFDYLNTLQVNAEQVATNPDLWLPWNYKQHSVELAQVA